MGRLAASLFFGLGRLAPSVGLARRLGSGPSPLLCTARPGPVAACGLQPIFLLLLFLFLLLLLSLTSRARLSVPVPLSDRWVPAVSGSGSLVVASRSCVCECVRAGARHMRRRGGVRARCCGGSPAARLDCAFWLGKTQPFAAQHAVCACVRPTKRSCGGDDRRTQLRLISTSAATSPAAERGKRPPLGLLVLGRGPEHGGSFRFASSRNGVRGEGLAEHSGGGGSPLQGSGGSL